MTGAALLQALYVRAPFMHELFGSAPIDVRALTVAGAAALVILPVTWVEERRRVARAAARVTRR